MLYWNCEILKLLIFIELICFRTMAEVEGWCWCVNKRIVRGAPDWGNTSLFVIPNCHSEQMVRIQIFLYISFKLRTMSTINWRQPIGYIPRSIGLAFHNLYTLHYRVIPSHSQLCSMQELAAITNIGTTFTLILPFIWQGINLKVKFLNPHNLLHSDADQMHTVGKWTMTF